MYLPWKTQLESIVKSRFPPFISDRFSFRTDSEIYIPKEDETIWKAVRSNKENMHVMFDKVVILEIPQSTPRNLGELFILRAFRDAIASGRILLEKIPEYVDNETARKNKKEKEKKKAKQVEDAFKFARDNSFDVERIEAKLPLTKKGGKGKTINKLQIKGSTK